MGGEANKQITFYLNGKYSIFRENYLFHKTNLIKKNKENHYYKN